MKKISIVIAAMALVLTFACKNQSSTNASAPDSNNNAATSVSQNSLTPEQLGELGAKIKKSPNDAQKLLSEQGLTQESFEKQIRQVAQDPDASKRYAAAYKKASA
jgi:UDP-N-acetylglucosamine:LPS N-acetylglucosamine transferase